MLSFADQVSKVKYSKGRDTTRVSMLGGCDIFLKGEQPKLTPGVILNIVFDSHGLTVEIRPFEIDLSRGRTAHLLPPDADTTEPRYLYPKQ